MTVQSPPLPQARYTDTEFVAYENDSYAQAHADARRELAKRYPSSADILEAEQSLIRQYMAGQRPAKT